MHGLMATRYQITWSLTVASVSCLLFLTCCPHADTTVVGDKAWVYRDVPATQLGARVACQGAGGDLLPLETPQDSTLLSERFPNSTLSPAWFGLMARNGISSTNKTSYVWSNGQTPTHDGWEQYQPDNFGGREGVCVGVASGTNGPAWYDYPCSNQFAYFCQLPGKLVAGPAKPGVHRQSHEASMVLDSLICRGSDAVVSACTIRTTPQQRQAAGTAVVSRTRQ